MPRLLLPLITLCLVLAGCGSRVQVSDEIYSAPGHPADIQQLVAVQAAQCWPGDDERLEGLNPAFADIDGEPAVILAGPATRGEAFFSVRFTEAGGDITDLLFPVLPEDEALARRMKDDVLLWANGTRACP
jgi:hypothetical protein